MDGLANARHERFCREFLKDRDPTAAAVRANYARWHAPLYGQALMARKEIRARILELEQAGKTAPGIDTTGLVADLQALHAVVASFRQQTAALQRLEQEPPNQPASEAPPARPRVHTIEPQARPVRRAAAEATPSAAMPVSVGAAKDKIRAFLRQSAADPAAPRRKARTAR